MFFFYIALSHALFTFLALNEKERWAIGVVVSGRFGLGKTSVEVVKELERNLIIPLNFLLMSNESYKPSFVID